MGFFDPWNGFKAGDLINPVSGYNSLNMGITDAYHLGNNMASSSYEWANHIGLEAWSAIKHMLVADMRKDREVQAQSSVNARTIVYGRTRVGNQIAYAETTGDKDQTLHVICIHAGHEIDGYEELYFDDKLVANSSGVAPAGWPGAWITGAWSVQAPFTGKVSFDFYDGTQTAACSAMVTASHGGWTNDHKLLGVAYSHVELTYSESIFPNGIPSIKVVLRGKRVYDPRTGKTAWSDNPHLCIRDYLLTPKEYGGCGASIEEVNETITLTAINIADQIVYSNIPSDQAAGVKTEGTIGSYPEKRYTLNGVIKLDGAPTQFIKDMLTSCAGDAVYSEGQWKLYAGAPSASVATIDESWLNGGISFQTGSNSNDKNNSVKGTFTNSNDFWADTEFPPVPVGVSTPPNAAYWSIVVSPAGYDATATYASGQYVKWASKVYQAYNAVPINTEPPSSSYWSLIEEHDNSLQYPPSHTVQRGGVVYMSTTTVPVANPYLAEDGGELLESNLTLPFTITSSEAQRLAKIAMEKSRRGFTLSYPCNHKAFKLEPMDVVTVVNQRMGMSKLFIVGPWSFTLMGGVGLSLTEYDAAIWDWSPGDSTPLVAPIITNLPDPYTVTAPTALLVADTTVSYTGDVTRSETTFSWDSTSAQGSNYIIFLDGVEYVTTINTSYTFRDLLVGSHTFGVQAVSTNGTKSAVASISHTVVSVNGTVSVSTIGAVPTTRTVNGHALSANIAVTASDILSGLPIYADNAAATSLSVGDGYRTATGQVMVKY